MPKKKKKEKSGGPPEDEANAASLDSVPASGAASGAASPAPTGSLLTGTPGSLLDKPPAASGQLPPIMKTSTLKDKDPNMKLLGNSEMDEMEQALSSHTEPPSSTGGGMNIFAINKDGISRAVVKFIDKPRPMPLTISFHFPGTFLTHRYVVAIIRGAVSNIEGADVTAVQYCDRNVRLGTRGLENRWLVTVNDKRAKQMLMLKGIKVVNRTIYVKSYDEVVGEEYREYQRWSDLQNRMKMGYGAKNKNKLETPAAPASTTSVTPAGEGSGQVGEGGDD